MGPAEPAYIEIVDFFAGGTTPETVANFRPSAAAQNPISFLLSRNSEGELSADERAELDHFIELEHILRMAKVRARQILSHAS